jgi:hypothetical protein
VPLSAESSTAMPFGNLIVIAALSSVGTTLAGTSDSDASIDAVVAFASRAFHQ